MYLDFEIKQTKKENYKKVVLKHYLFENIKIQLDYSFENQDI